MKFNGPKLKQLLALGGRKSVLRLAAKLDISPKAIYNWLAGTASPTITRLGEIAKLMNVNPADLLDM